MVVVMPSAHDAHVRTSHSFDSFDALRVCACEICTLLAGGGGVGTWRCSPIGEADHDILSLEITVSLRRCKHKPRQVLKYSKANWDNIKQDLKTIYHKINQSQDSQDIDSMWNLFKDSLQMSISKNIPTKTTKYDNKLPWISGTDVSFVKGTQNKNRKVKS